MGKAPKPSRQLPTDLELAERLKLKVSFFDGLEGRVWTVSEHYCVLFMAKTLEEADAYYQALVEKRGPLPTVARG